MGIVLVLACVFANVLKVEGQTTIALQDFENTPATPTLTYSNTNGSFSSGVNSGLPAANMFANGSRAWRANNQTSTLNFTNTSLASYSNCSINFKMAGMSLNATNGVDAADLITVFISTDNGSTYSSELTIASASANQRWAFSATGSTSMTCDGNNSPTAVTASAASPITDVTLNLPDTYSQVRIRITMTTNDANEVWIIDDVKIVGTIMSACAAPINAGTATITSTTGCASTSFTLNATGVSVGTGISYQWQSSPTGLAGTWTNISGANATSLATSASSTTYYQLLTTCSNDNSTNTTNTVSYTVTGSPCTCVSYSVFSATSALDADITNVLIGSMNNTSLCAAVVGTGGIASRYSNYTGSVSGPTVQLGSTVSFSLTSNVCTNSAYDNGFQLYIDWNQNGNFSDAGEQVYSASASVSGSHIETGSFVVPLTATLGTTRMRVVNVEIAFPTTTNYAQTNYSWGETEDYCITLTAASACSGTPSPGNTVATPSAVTSGSTVNLSLQNTTTGSGVTYLWYSSTTSASGPWTSTGVTTATYSPTITQKTWFQCVVTCSGSSTTSSPVVVTLAPCTTSLYSTGCSANDFINNISISDLNQTATGCTGGTGFADFTATTINFTQGVNYPWTITSAATSEMLGFWIDFNDNGSFADAGEFIGGTTVSSSTTTITGSVSIPVSASIGLHRMRVRLVYGSTNTQSLSTSCTNYSWGETHDYTANIVAAPSCTGTPTPGNTIASATSVPSGTTVNLSLQNATTGSGVTYQWYSSTTSATGPWTTIGSATNATYSTAVSVQTWFYCVVTCPGNGGTSSTPVGVTVTLTPNVDCSSAIQLCSDSQVNGASSGAGIADLTISTSGCLSYSSESQSNWFYSQVSTTGVFSFSITPANGTDDYDFAVWRFSGTPATCPPQAQPDRCSFAAVGGNTGLGNNATDASEGTGGDRWVSTLNVNAGDYILILVNNYSATYSPFTMDFTGNSGLNCNPVNLQCNISGTTNACIGSSVQLTGSGSPAVSTPWTSSSPTVATVSNTGVVSGLSAGTTTITYVNSNGCSTSILFTVSSTTINISNITTTVCSGNLFTVSPTNGTNGAVPAGTTYTWSAPTLNPSNSITGGSAQASPQPSISQTLTNTTTASATATYTVTPTSGTCVGSTFTVTVTVDPPVNYGTVAGISAGGGGSSNVVIYQVYGGGGNSGATYTNDFVVLYNPTGSAVNLSGWSLQYAAATGTTWTNNLNLTGTIQSGGYFLVQLASGANGVALPTPDQTGIFNMSTTAGKLVLLNTTTVSSSGTVCPSSNVIDLVGFGTSTDCREGVGTANNAPAPSVTNWITRASNGCQDTQVNSADFSSGNSIAPKSSASPLNPCIVSFTTSFCGSGIPGAMSVTGVSGGTSYTYQWYSQTGAVSCPTGSSTAGWTSLGASNGANTATYTPSAAISTTTTYACLVTINGSSCSTPQWSTSCITITINPSASLLPMSTAICTGNTISFTPTDGINGTIPASTTFTWTAPTNTGVSGGTSGSGTTISSAFTGSGTAVYTLTPTTGTCVGATATLTVTVDPCSPMQNCNLLVYAVGDGTTSLSSNSNALPVRLLEISQSGALVQSITSLFTGNNLLTAPGSGVSQGFLNSYNGLTAVPGLNLNVNATNSNTNNNKVTSIISGGVLNLVTRQVHPTSGTVPFTGDNYRSVIPTSSTTFYAAGNASNSTDGVWYYNGSNFNQLVGLNARNVEIFNNQLYVSQSSAINEVGTGTPTAGTQVLNQILTYTNASIYDFSISPDGCTMYVADNGSSSYRGVTKWTKSTINGTWTAGINYPCYGYGLAVDYSGSSHIIYLTLSTTNATAAPNQIICLTDNGSFTLSWTYTAASNYRLAGIDFTPNSTTVVSNPITTQPIASANLCNSQTQTLSVAHAGSATYQWYSHSTNSTCGAIAISGATSAIYTPPATGINGIVYYFVKVSVNCSQIFFSNISAITTVINPTPSATNNGPICVGVTLTLQTPTVSGASYSWTGPNSFSSSTQDPTVTSNATIANSGTYSITTTVSGCTSPAGTTNVTINQPPGINAISPP